MDPESKGAFLKFEDFLDANVGNQEAFWSQRGVRKRLGIVKLSFIIEPKPTYNFKVKIQMHI